MVGKKLVDALKSNGHDKRAAQELMQNNFFFRVDKQDNKTLEISSQQYFDTDGYYIWQWQSPRQRWMSFLISAGLILGVLVLVMFPLWPDSMRTGVWYISMGGVGLVGVLFVLGIIRLVLFVISLILPWTRPGIWLFPNLFADVGVVDSFIPLWGWHGINYERMHLEKYKKQAKRKSKKKKDNDEPLLEPSNSETANTSSKKNNGKSDSDEVAEELHMD